MPNDTHNRDDCFFAAAFAALPDAACILEQIGTGRDGGNNWRFVTSNPAMQSLFDTDDLTGLSLREVFPWGAEHWHKDFARVIATGQPETLYRQGSIKPQIYEAILSPLQHEGRKAILAKIRDVTSEQAARQSRREADARYKTLFNAIDEGFCIVELLFDDAGTGIDYRFLEANDAFGQHTVMIDPIGKRMRELQPDIEDHWSAIYGRIAQSGVSERFESESPALGQWFDVFAFPIGDTAPFLVGILFEDIGDRKSMELALRHSESRLQSLIEASSDLIFRMNPDWTMMHQLRGTGLFAAGEETTNWIETHIPEDEQARMKTAIKAAISNREPFDMEHRVRAPDGSIKWLCSRAVPILDEDGAIIEWFGMATDITGRRKSEEELLHGAQMLRVASEIGNVGIWDWDIATNELIWSDQYFRMQGYAVGEVTPSEEIWAKTIHPDDRADAKAKIIHAMETGEEYINEYRVCHRNGDIRWLSSRGGFIFDTNGTAIRMLGAMVDTTERRRQEEWQKLLVAELQHRVRNLISMVRSVARLSAPSHDDVEEYVDHFIGRLQAMGRTQSTLTRSPGAKVDLAELVREELLVHAAREDHCRIEGPDVALSPHAAEIVTLAIHELATNSIKYGALGDRGFIRINWTTCERDNAPWIDLSWQETSPRQGVRPIRKGFGMQLIEERIPYELHGEGRLDVHDTGVLAQLAFPLTEGSSILETGSHKGRAI